MGHFNSEIISCIKKTIYTSKNICLLTHQNPDGDTLGGAFALYYFLQKKGINSYIIFNENFPHCFNWMMYDTPVKSFFSIEDPSIIDTFILIDHSLFSRSEKTHFSIKEHAAKKIIIDHHINIPDKVDHEIIDKNSESTCKLIYQLIEDFREVQFIDKKIAKCLYAGIITDTGNFSHGKITSSTFHAVSKLLDKGVNTDYIYNEIYQNFTLDRINLLGFILFKKIKLIGDRKSAYITINNEELNRFNFKPGDTEGVVNYPLSINGVKISILIVENNNVVRISFRSKNNIPINQYANRYFNGGGHLNAAGATSKKPLEEVIECVKNTLPEFLQSLEKK